MRPLVLSGWGVKIRTRNLASASDLEITNGRTSRDESKPIHFRPRRFPYDSVVIDGHSGYVSLQALHWLSRHNVPIFMMNHNGELLQSMLPPVGFLKPDVRIAQWEAYQNRDRRVRIAQAIIRGKVNHSIEHLRSYGLEKDIRKVTWASLDLEKADSVVNVMHIEAMAAVSYWGGLSKLIDESLVFQRRVSKYNQCNATDPVNATLNYGYALLEAECLKAINEVGLEPSIGFIHSRLTTRKIPSRQTLPSLAYDLMEPYRFLVDHVVIGMFTHRMLSLNDFYFTGDNYSYQIEDEAKQQLIDELRTCFHMRIEYKGERSRWATVIRHKTNGLARYLVDSSRELDFSEPTPTAILISNKPHIRRQDDS